MLDYLTKIAIDFSAARLANDENPDFEGRLIDIITEDHTKRAIREYFSDCEEWSEDILPAALEAYNEAAQIEAAVSSTVGSIFDYLLNL